MERLSVMASTADIQVNANRGRTTQELHREALSEEKKETEGEEGRAGGRRSNKVVQSQTRKARFGKSQNSTSHVLCLTHTRVHPLIISQKIQWWAI